MSVTITLNNPLAEELQTQASARRLTVKEFAVRLLGQAVQQLDKTERWQVQNERRCHNGRAPRRWSCDGGFSASRLISHAILHCAHQAGIDDRVGLVTVLLSGSEGVNCLKPTERSA